MTTALSAVADAVVVTAAALYIALIAAPTIATGTIPLCMSLCYPHNFCCHCCYFSYCHSYCERTKYCYPCFSSSFVCLGFLTSSLTTGLYRGWVPHTRQRGETIISASAGHIIGTPTQPVRSGRPQQESNPGPPHQELHVVPIELPPLPSFV